MTGFDPGAPSAARMWDAASGGRNFCPADAELVKRVLEICPNASELIQVVHQFSRRAVGSAGCSQVIELGAGLHPSHVVEAAKARGATVALVDSDAVIAVELPAVLGSTRDQMASEGIAVACCDLRDPAAVLGNPEVQRVIDPGRPVLLLASGVLHLLDPSEAGEAMAAWADVLAPGSVAAVSVPAIPDETLRRRMEEAHPLSRYGATADTVRGWLAAYDLLASGRVNKFGIAGDPGTPRGLHIIGGVGRKGCDCPCAGQCTRCGFCQAAGCLSPPVRREPTRMRRVGNRQSL